MQTEKYSEYQKTIRAALVMFLGGSSMVYALAIAYCAVTKNFFALSLVLTGVGIISAVVYLLFRKGF